MLSSMQSKCSFLFFSFLETTLETTFRNSAIDTKDEQMGWLFWMRLYWFFFWQYKQSIYGDERYRTVDFMRAKHTFYQLNYIPLFSFLSAPDRRVEWRNKPCWEWKLEYAKERKGRVRVGKGAISFYSTCSVFTCFYPFFVSIPNLAQRAHKSFEKVQQVEPKSVFLPHSFFKMRKNRKSVFPIFSTQRDLLSLFLLDIFHTLTLTSTESRRRIDEEEQ